MPNQSKICLTTLATEIWPWKVIFHISDRIWKIGQTVHDSATLGNLSYLKHVLWLFRTQKYLARKIIFRISEEILKIWCTGCTPMCNFVPNVQQFFEQFVFCPVSLLCNTPEEFQFQNDKNQRKWVKHGFQNNKIDL